MGKLIFEGYSGYSDPGVEDFSFIYNGDRFKIYPKVGVPGSRDKLQAFLKYVQYIAPKSADKNPWTYRVSPDQDFSKFFDIYKNGKKLEDKKKAPPQKPDAEQLSLPLTAALDRIGNKLESLGRMEDAFRIDAIANSIDKWLGNKSTLFFDEIENHGIPSDMASKVLDIAKKQGIIEG
jgi:hypothetical protein